MRRRRAIHLKVQIVLKEKMNKCSKTIFILPFPDLLIIGPIPPFLRKKNKN